MTPLDFVQFALVKYDVKPHDTTHKLASLYIRISVEDVREPALHSSEAPFHARRSFMRTVSVDHIASHRQRANLHVARMATMLRCLGHLQGPGAVLVQILARLAAWDTSAGENHAVLLAGDRGASQHLVEFGF